MLQLLPLQPLKGKSYTRMEITTVEAWQVSLQCQKTMRQGCTIGLLVMLHNVESAGAACNVKVLCCHVEETILPMQVLLGVPADMGLVCTDNEAMNTDPISGIIKLAKLAWLGHRPQT